MVPVAIGAVSALGKIQKVSQLLGSVNKTISNIAGKIGLGGVTQDRFFERYNELKSSFKNGGYPVSGAKHDELLTSNKIRKTQVEDKKKNGNYEPEFKRLHNWVREMLDFYNPGLGGIWSEQFPQFTMVNLGNISDKDPALQAAKILIENFKPGEFDVNTEGDALIRSMNTTTPSGAQMLNSTPSQIINSGSGGDMTSTSSTATIPQTMKAGISLPDNKIMILLAIGVLVLLIFSKK